MRKREVMRHYDRLADIYDAQYGDEQRAKIRASLELVDIWSSDLVLDVGCGTGLLFERVGGSAKILVGLDISRKILRRAKTRARRFGGVSLIQADADHMPFPDSTFDKVFAITLLQNMPDVEKTVKEMVRVSKPDATLVITGLKKSFSVEGFLEVLFRVGLEVLSLNADEGLKGYVAVCRVGA